MCIRDRPEDVRIIHSPVGMPGRALNTPLVQKLAEGLRFPPKRCARCLKACDPAKVPYCITHALIEAVKGNVEEGLFFCGANVGQLDRMRSGVCNEEACILYSELLTDFERIGDHAVNVAEWVEYSITGIHESNEHHPQNVL